MSNPSPSKPFTKGDPRINRKGRPKSFDALRELAQQIAHEPTTVVIDGHKVTVAEAILRQWAQSKNPQLQRAFIEVAFGKAPSSVDITSGGEKITNNILEIIPIDYRTAITDLAPRPVGDSDPSGEGQNMLDGAQVG